MLSAVVLVLSGWSDPPTAWRILPAKRYNDDDPWLVRELQVFASPDCTGDPIPAATPIGSSPHGLPRAVDGLYDSDLLELGPVSRMLPAAHPDAKPQAQEGLQPMKRGAPGLAMRCLLLTPSMAIV